MAVAFVQGKWARDDDGGSSSVTFDSTPTNGNLMLWAVSAQQTGTLGTPSGWTAQFALRIGADFSLALFTKTAGASESATLTITTTAFAFLGAMEVSGQGTLTLGTGNTESGEFDSSTNVPGQNVDAADAMHILVAFASGGFTSGTPAAPTNYTRAFTSGSDAYAGRSLMAYRANPPTGATGDKAFTHNTAGDDEYGRGVVIEAAGGGGGGDQPASKRHGGVPAMALPGRRNVWAPVFKSNMLIGPSSPIMRKAA